MELSSLRILCDLIETTSFSKAAERNFISQSAVSQRLRSLERELGQILIERGKGKGKIAPTEAGSILYESGIPLLREADALVARIRDLSDEIAGTVRVATVYSVGLHALPGRLKPFLAEYPLVNVHLEYSRTTMIYQDVLAGSVDVGIVACPTERSGLEIIPFGEQEMCLICAPENPLAKEKAVSLKQLEGSPFIGFTDDIPTRKLIDAHLRSAGVKVRLVAEYDNIETIKNLVEIGSGVALVPKETARQEAREGVLTLIPLSEPSAFRRPEGILVRKSGIRRAAVLAFIEATRSVRE